MKQILLVFTHIAENNQGCGNHIYIKTSSATPNLNAEKVYGKEEEKEDRTTRQMQLLS